MKCKCGNENGQPLVFPRPHTVKIKGEVIHLIYMGGQSADGTCWFCAFPRREL